MPRKNYVSAKAKAKQGVNYYNKLPKHLKPVIHNPLYDEHKIEVPFRMLVVAGSGGGKTNCMLDILSKLGPTFKQIVVMTKCADEPLYNYLAEMVGDGVVFYEINDDNPVPTVEHLTKMYGKEPNKLVIFDDLLTDKKANKEVEHWFIRARKSNFSMAYLTQSYFKTNKTIRNQCNYVILKKLSQTRDLSMILDEFNLGIDKDVLFKMYKSATEIFTNFLLIDAFNAKHKFRKHLYDVLDPADF